MDTIAPKKWSDFQHYKDRSPPWLKLHRSLLDDFDFHCLPVASKAIAPLLWLLASEYKDGRIPLEYDRIGFRLRMSGKDAMQSIKPLIERGFFVLEQDASDLLAGCLPRDREREETEIETEGEGEGEGEAKETADAVAEVFTHWQAVMGKQRTVLDEKRRKLIRARLKDGYAVDDLKDAITGYSLSPFHMGLNDRGQRYDGLDLILRDASKVDQGLAFKANPPRPMSKADQVRAGNERALDDWINEGQNGVIDGEVLHAR